MTSFHLSLFVLGFLSALVFGFAVKILTGLRHHLYLSSDEQALENRNFIAVTTELKETSLWKTLVQKKWREDILMTLMDYKGTQYHWKVNYHLFAGFCLVLQKQGPSVKLDGVPIRSGKRYFLRNEMNLQMGDRKFKIVISPFGAHQLMLDSLNADGT